MLQLARPEDREAVNALAMQVHEMHIAWRPDIFEPAEELYPQDRFDEAVRKRLLYVAKIDNAVVGYVAIQYCNIDRPGMVRRRGMLVDEFCVHESCRGQGLGKQMMEDVHALAMAFGCRDLQLRVYPQNDDAVGFYQRCGFTIRSIEMQQSV